MDCNDDAKKANKQNSPDTFDTETNYLRLILYIFDNLIICITLCMGVAELPRS
jgi:hypothetical protein